MRSLKNSDEPQVLTFGEALKLIGGLSAPSKMPWYSYSISATKCHVGGDLQKIKGSVCENCYALKGNYVFKNVKQAHERRLEALKHPQFVDAFIIVLEGFYAKARDKKTHFRWHDAGDLQDMEHLLKIVAIAKRCPQFQFWLPTKESKLVGEYLKLFKEFPTNLTVRLSHPMVGQQYKKVPHGLTSSSVGVKSATNHCPAYTQGGKCLDCRACWDPKVKNINYPAH